MITKERLEELIKEKAIIYEAKYNYIEAVDLSKRKINLISEKDNMISFEPEINERWKHHKYFDKLFETEEDARWELEMTATRTETLKMPTWEEFARCYVFNFYDNNHNLVKLFSRYAFSKNKDNILIWTNAENGKYLFQEVATKENYIEACKLCLKLFKGEKDE